MSAPWLQEIFLDPVHESRRVGVRLGEVVVLPWLVPTANIEGETPDQLEEVFDLLDTALAQVGGGRAEVARVTVYLADVGDRPLLNAAWAARYPDPADRPPHKYVPAPLPEGVRVAIGVLAVLGAARSVLEVSGLVHSDPMSIGARTGNVVASSRLFASEADVVSQFEVIVGHAAAVLDAAGGSLADLVQTTFFVGSPEIADEVTGLAGARFGAASDPPVIYVREANLGSGNGYPRLEVVALGRRDASSD